MRIEGEFAFVGITDYAQHELGDIVFVDVTTEGETIAAGIAYTYRKDGKGGYVAEGHIHGSAESLKEILKWKMDEMARIRNTEFEEIRFVTEELAIPLDNYGCCVAALVFTEYR